MFLIYNWFYERIHLDPNLSLRDLWYVFKSFVFQFQTSFSICEDLSRAYTRSKKNYALIDDWENIEWQKQGVTELVWLVPKTAEIFCVVSAVQPLGKLCNFYPRLRSETDFAALKLSSYLNYLHLWIVYNMPERQSSQSEKTWKPENLKNPNFLTF